MSKTNNEVATLTDIMLSDLKEILDNIQAYKAVDATLSKETMLTVCGFIRSAKVKLESGFVHDACKEIENELNIN